ncbi:MAG: Rieske 2Fe-2S domain-containing protein [Sporichthyaceae bacterium]
MSEPEGPDATRRTLIRGVVVLGVVGAGAGLSRLGEGTLEIPSAAAAGAETDTAVQADAPAEPAATAEPAAAEQTKPAPKAEPKTKAEKAEPTKTAKKAEATGKTEPTKTAKKAEATEKTEPKKAAKAAKPAGAALGPSSKVPVGGGTVFKDKKLVVCQPTKGQYTVYDALCTHAACLVTDVKDNAIHCPCHNAKFSAADGTPIKPSVARRPLNAKPGKITEADGTLYLS